MGTRNLSNYVLNIGSLNIDHVYQVPHFVQPGETLSSTGYNKNAGGKGLNQSIAMVRAGLNVVHAGKIGEDGLFLKQLLQREGIGTQFVLTGETPTGHAIIQVVPSGQNDILLFPGANCSFTENEIRDILDAQPQNAWIALQNEINNIPFIIEEAYKRHLPVAINPAPCTPQVCSYPLNQVSLLFVNEIEASQLTGLQADAPPEQLADGVLQRWPELRLVITLGAQGALYADAQQRLFEPALNVKAVDTTAAGDTFCGYFLAALLQKQPVSAAMKQATRAAAITVTRPGAAQSIPVYNEVLA